MIVTPGTGPPAASSAVKSTVVAGGGVIVSPDVFPVIVKIPLPKRLSPIAPPTDTTPGRTSSENVFTGVVYIMAPPIETQPGPPNVPLTVTLPGASTIETGIDGAVAVTVLFMP